MRNIIQLQKILYGLHKTVNIKVLHIYMVELVADADKIFSQFTRMVTTNYT